MSYTQGSHEDRQLLGVLYPASYASEQNLGFYNIKGFHRIDVEIFAGNIGTSLDVDFEVATDASATGLFTLKSITQLTEAGGDDNSSVKMVVQSEELSKPSGASSDQYDWIRVEVTPNGATLCCVAVYGYIARYKPVSTTAYDQIVT